MWLTTDKIYLFWRTASWRKQTKIFEKKEPRYEVYAQSSACRRVGIRKMHFHFQRKHSIARLMNPRCGKTWANTLGSRWGWSWNECQWEYANHYDPLSGEPFVMRPPPPSRLQVPTPRAFLTQIVFGAMCWAAGLDCIKRKHSGRQIAVVFIHCRMFGKIGLLESLWNMVRRGKKIRKFNFEPVKHLLFRPTSQKRKKWFHF